MLVPIGTVFSSSLVFPYPHTEPQLCCGYSWKMIILDCILFPHKTGIKIWYLYNCLVVEKWFPWICVCKRCLSCMSHVIIFVGLPYWTVFHGYPKKGVRIYERQCIVNPYEATCNSSYLVWWQRQGSFRIKISVFSYISESMLVCDVFLSHMKWVIKSFARWELLRLLSQYNSLYPCICGFYLSA